MAKRKWKDIEQSLILGLFGIAILGWLIWSIYQAFWMPEQPEKTIRFEVTGITGPLNASTLTQLHYECIQYCMSHTSGENEQDKCWNQCALLGKEECEKQNG